MMSTFTKNNNKVWVLIKHLQDNQEKPFDIINLADVVKKNIDETVIIKRGVTKWLAEIICVSENFDYLFEEMCKLYEKGSLGENLDDFSDTVKFLEAIDDKMNDAKGSTKINIVVNTAQTLQDSRRMLRFPVSPYQKIVLPENYEEEYNLVKKLKKKPMCVQKYVLFLIFILVCVCASLLALYYVWDLD